jgi:hypothetical protein
LIATWLHDRYNNTKLKKYIYLTTVLLTVYIILLFPNRQYLRTKSEERGIELGEYIVKYKKQYGKYPDSLNNDFFNEAPQRSYFGTKFQVTTSIDNNGKDTNCFIEYPSLNGYFGIYPIKTKKWHYVD